MLKLSYKSHNALIDYVLNVQNMQAQYTEYKARLEAIDEAYAKNRISVGEDTGCSPSTLTSDEAIKVPIVNSEVDTTTAELVSTFVSTYPLFPVIGSDPKAAFQLQALIEKDARQQQWRRNLISFITKASRYNVAAIEITDVTQKDYRIDETNIDGRAKHEAVYTPVTRLNSLDMYNTLFDYRKPAAEISRLGEYAGYNSYISRTELAALGVDRARKGIAYNLDKAYKSETSINGQYWNTPPAIAISQHLGDEQGQTNWIAWLNNEPYSEQKLPNASYFYTRLYARIIPQDMGIKATNPAHPRIVRLEVINNKWIISYEEIITPMDMLPILFSDLREDGLGWQTYSVAENTLPWQDAATEMLFSRMESTKRAVYGKALYDTDYIDSADVNSPTASHNIPVRNRLRSGGDRADLFSIYRQIPYDSAAAASTMADINTIMALKDKVNGLGMSVRGEHRKGNRTLGEFNAVENAAGAKSSLYALRLEDQVMTPLRTIVKHQLLSSPTVEQEVLDTIGGTKIPVNMLELRKSMLDYRLLDGLQNRNRYLNPNSLNAALQYMLSDTTFNQVYDTVSVFETLMLASDVDITRHRRLQDGDRTQQATTAVQPAGGPDTQGTV